MRSRDLTAALEALMGKFEANTVPPLVQRGTAPAARSGAPIVAGQGGTVSDGTVGAFPLTETDYAARQWWPEKTVTTTDGLFAIRFKPIKQITFLDANSQALTFNYKGPD